MIRYTVSYLVGGEGGVIEVSVEMLLRSNLGA